MANKFHFGVLPSSLRQQQAVDAPTDVLQVGFVTTLKLDGERAGVADLAEGSS